MPKAQTLAAEPRVLIAARERRGFTRAEAAAELRVPVDELKRIEDGSEEVRVTLLLKMEKKYRISFATLVSDEPPRVPDPPRDFRTLLGASRALSSETRINIAEVHMYREHLADLFEDLDEPVPPHLPQLALDSDPLTCGASERRRLGLTDEQQLAWSGRLAALRWWRRRIEDQGIFVLSLRMPRRDCRGFSVDDKAGPPAIVVNSTEQDQAKLFTLLHEYGHLLLRAAGMCDEQARGRSRRWERFANQFAGAAMMSDTVVVKAADSLGIMYTRNVWTANEVAGMATRLRVSRPALALRLEDLGFARPGLYDSLKDQWATEIWREPKDGWAEQHQRTFNRLGSAYVGRVFEALDRGVIRASEADRLLDLRSKHFDDLRVLSGGRT